jgi:mannose/cellobiose epimerase-like protein (N-acyl-D-glucosamine 2-epimerase family)
MGSGQEFAGLIMADSVRVLAYFRDGTLRRSRALFWVDCEWGETCRRCLRIRRLRRRWGNRKILTAPQ